MKVSFLYDGLHPAHEAWAESVNAKFVSDRIPDSIPNISRFIKSFTVVKDIPSDTDLLLCESGAEILAGALWKRKNPEKKLVLIVTDPKLALIPKMSFLKRKIHLWALSFYDMFVATSRLMERSIPPDLPGISKVVPSFVNDEYRNHEPANPRKKNVVFVGRVGRMKGVDQIVDAFNILREDFPESKLYIVGDGALKKRLEKNYENVVCTGHVTDPIKYFLEGSIHMNLSRIEPFGIAILEAMCLGLVPIVTEGVGVVDVIRKIAPELVVGSPAEAADIAKKLWESPELHKEYSEKGIELAREFSKESSLEKFRSVFAEL